ncbi:MAG TPA: alpha/beta hydrolase [Cerasibacillus sp.]|uniref:alpha/beta hydrolase n=1 Tax=Cerasibacillus sp. TaxID=2498711 RepID=UPI002F3EBE54
MKKWGKRLAVLGGILFIILVCSSYYFYHLAIQRGEKKFLEGNQDLEVSAQAMEEFIAGDWREWVREQQFQDMMLTSFDDLKLKGYFLEAKQPSNKLVVFAHGYLGHGKQMGLFGQYYYEELGFNVFMPDLRGHGQSEGAYYGFGWHDRLDLIDWTNQLIDQLGEDTEIIYHGLSMGAATVLMASGETLPSQVKAIIADSPYTDVYELFKYQMDKMFHLPAFPLLDLTSVITNIKADYTLKEASALKQVKKAQVPILYIHGENDTFVPTHMTRELAEHTSSHHIVWTVPHANHGEAFVLEKETYIQKIQSFLNKYVKD